MRQFEVLKRYGIRIRADKCIWATEETEFLGFIINRYGIKPTEKYKNKVLDVTQPTDKTQVQRFLGLVNYLHRFIPSLHKYVAPLTKLTHKDVDFDWKSEHSLAFSTLKKLIGETKFLHHPDFDKPFFLFTDASNVGIGGVLTQQDDQKRYVICEFGSKLFNKTQQNWHLLIG